MDIGTSTFFFGVFLLIGLNNHFTDGFAENGTELQIKFEMEFFNEYERMYDSCHESIDKIPFSTRASDWFKISQPVKTEAMQVFKITNHLKTELTCLQITDNDIKVGENARPLAIKWFIQFLANDCSFIFLEIYAMYKTDNQEIAGKFLRLAAYLAAFGADFRTGNLLYAGIKHYVHQGKYLHKAKIPEDIPYTDFVTEIQKIIYNCYDADKNQLKMTTSALLGSLFTDMEMYSQLINSYLEYAVLGEHRHYVGENSVPTPPYSYNILWASALEASKSRGQSSQSSKYDIEVLWESIWAIENILSEAMRSEEVRRGAWYGSSRVIELLRKIEILKIRLHQPEKWTSDKIEEITKGFNNEGTLETYGVEFEDTGLEFLIFAEKPAGSLPVRLANGLEFLHQFPGYTELKKH